MLPRDLIDFSMDAASLAIILHGELLRTCSSVVQKHFQLVRHIAQTVKDLKDKISCAMPAPERHHSRCAQCFDLSPKHDKHKRVTPDEPAPVIASYSHRLRCTCTYCLVCNTSSGDRTHGTCTCFSFYTTSDRERICGARTCVIEYIAPPPAVFYPSFSQQLPPAFTNEAVTGLVNPQISFTAVEAHRCKLSFRKFLRFGS